MKQKIYHIVSFSKEKVTGFWHSLQPRERLLVGSTFIVLAVLFVLQVNIIAPIKEIKSADQEIYKIKQNLIQLNVYHKQYHSLKRKQVRKNVSANKTGQDSLLAILEKMTVDNNIKTNVRYMRPSTVPVEGKYNKRTVEIKIESALLLPLLKFMYDAENFDPNISTENYLLRDAYNKPGYYDLTIRVIRLEKT